MTADLALNGCEPLTDVLRASLEDPELFAVVYDRYADQLFQYAQRRLGPDAAQDVVAETFLAAFGRRARYDDAWPVGTSNRSTLRRCWTIREVGRASCG